MEINTYHRIMGAGALAGRTAKLIGTQITLGGFYNGGSGEFIKNKVAVPVTDVHHADIVIRTGVGAHGTADAGRIVNDDLAFLQIPMDGARRATDHTYRVYAVHTGIGDHVVTDLWPMSNKAWVVLVRGRAGANTVIAPGTAVKIDHHGLSAVDQAFISEKF